MPAQLGPEAPSVRGFSFEKVPGSTWHQGAQLAGVVLFIPVMLLPLLLDLWLCCLLAETAYSSGLCQASEFLCSKFDFPQRDL